MDVLLASARPDLRFALQVLLREQPGLAVTGTATGAEGLLALVEATCPDVVIFDWELPGRQPADILAEARTLDCPPFVIILGKDEAAHQAALNAGADAFVVRGDSPEHLLDAVRQARSRSGATAELQSRTRDPIPTEAKGE
jgi:DNA-binding NarL/FixJ family response regulator